MANNLTQLVAQANQLFSQRKYKKAQELYEQCLKLEPQNPTLNFNLAVAYQVQGKEAKALKYYKKAPHSPDALNNLGIIYKKQGDLKKARESYQAALKLNPNHSNAQANLKSLLTQKVNPRISANGLPRVRLAEAESRRVETGGSTSGGHLGKPPKPPQSAPSITAQIPEGLKNSIRNSFTYKGLLKALNKGIITPDDIKAEAKREQKNKKLLLGQRVHTVLLADLASGRKRPEKTPVPKRTVNISKEAKSISPTKLSLSRLQEQLLKKIKDLLGPDTKDFKAGWKGIDGDGDIVQLTQITDDGWVRFTIEKSNGTQDSFAYPIDKFIKEVEKNPLFKLDEEEARDLAASNLSSLDEQGRINLLQRIHQKTMSLLQEIQNQQRRTIEKILKQDENKKIKQTLNRIYET